MKDDVYRRLLSFMRELDEAKITFSLQRHRDDAIMVMLSVPGERWEVEFVDYGDEVHTEIERFVSNGEIYDEQMIEELFTKFTDRKPVSRDGATV